jgi:hypothetical protein
VLQCAQCAEGTEGTAKINTRGTDGERTWFEMGQTSIATPLACGKDSHRLWRARLQCPHDERSAAADGRQRRLPAQHLH